MEALQDDRGEWVEDTGRLQQMAVAFYSKLFQSETVGGADFLVGHFSRLSEVCTR